MSGGSYGYLYAQIKETYIGDMQDPELDDMMKDSRFGVVAIQ